MQEQISRLATQLATVQAQQALNHEQNRKSIRDIREDQKKYTDALYAGFDRMALSLEKALAPIKQDIFDLQMWKSKTTGYVVGISALAALIFKIVEVGLSKAGMH
jgi:hypothetical protein